MTTQYWNNPAYRLRTSTNDTLFASLYKNPDGSICSGGDDCIGACVFFMSSQQNEALQNLCKRYDVPFDPLHYTSQWDLPEGYLAGWIGGPEHALMDHRHNTTIPKSTHLKKPTIYVGVSIHGEVSS